MHAAIIGALITAHRRELGELRALCAIYRDQLEQAGIEPPADAQGAEALRRYRRLFEATGMQDPEQHSELTADWWLSAPLVG